MDDKPSYLQFEDKEVQTFIDLYEKETGERLSLAQGHEIYANLLTLYLKLYSPLPSELKEMGLDNVNPDEEWLY